MASWLHTAGGIVLLFFGISHLGFLRIPDPSHDLHSTVFPFLTGRALYVIAAAFEISTALVCLEKRGQGITNVIILTFVAVIVWYRWAFNYTGGQYCGCLGMFGRLLHISKVQEKTIPLIALGFLVLTTLPWLWSGCARLWSGRSRYLLLLGILFAPPSKSSGEQIIQIRGTVDIQEYNPNTGKAYEKQQSHNEFVATVIGNSWKFSVTNVVWRPWWAELVFTGGSTYVLLPFEDALYPPFGGFGRTTPPSSNRLSVTIESSPRFIQHATDNLGLSMIWLTYALSPQWATGNRSGLVEIPLSGARENPAAFGYKWLMEDMPGGRFVKTCQIVRDRTLDLNDKGELFRPELDYPETLGTYNEYLQELGNRKHVPDGFVKARYQCTESRQLGDLLVVPAASEYEVYQSPSASSRPWRVVQLKTVDIAVRSGIEEILPAITTPIDVTDYRYKKANKSRIFKYAEYSLNSGDSWKTEKDPALLAKAEDWLKHGRKYSDFADRPKIFTAWLLLAIVLSPVLIMWYKRQGTPDKTIKIQQKET